MSGFQNIRIFLLKDMLQTRVKRFCYKADKEYSTLDEEEIVGSFYEKELQKTNKKNLELKK